jgi:hypothetical protein
MTARLGKGLVAPLHPPRRCLSGPKESMTTKQERRCCRVSLRVSARERESIETAASRAGLCLSDYLRRIVLAAKPLRARRRPPLEIHLAARLLVQLGAVVRFGRQQLTPQDYSNFPTPSAEALEIGLIDRLTNPQDLLKDAQAWARELSQGSRIALALSKAILDKSFELSGEEVSALGREAQAICYTTTEHQESVAAFLSKEAR